jgi:inorganic pyrophosphatase
MLPASFWDALQEFVDQHEIVIDRPGGSSHPRYPDYIYPHDYGYFQGTHASDGSGIDVWLGSLKQRRVSGVILTVDRAKMDLEVKVLLGCSKADSDKILQTHCQGSQSGILIPNPRDRGEGA